MPLGPSQAYLAQYNGYTLPGYVQSESFDSIARIADHYAPYADGSLSENMGLQNKQLTLTLKVWEQDYATCKQQVQQAATMLRSKRAGFAPLYVQFDDRHYEALVNKISIDKNAGASVRTLDYQVDFTCKPWALSDTQESFNGTSTITTTGRTIDDGGWTYANIDISGTNVTVSGYTATEPFTGYLRASGSVTNLIIDSENFTATQGGVNKNSIMTSVDYRMLVGPEETNFLVTGASACTITYYNRWYI